MLDNETLDIKILKTKTLNEYVIRNINYLVSVVDSLYLLRDSCIFLHGLL